MQATFLSTLVVRHLKVSGIMHSYGNFQKIVTMIMKTIQSHLKEDKGNKYTKSLTQKTISIVK